MTIEQEPPNLELQDDDLNRRYAGVVPPKPQKLGCFATALILGSLGCFALSMLLFFGGDLLTGGVMLGCALLACILLSLMK